MNTQTLRTFKDIVMQISLKMAHSSDVYMT